jgi:hypothetical protein
MEERLVRQADTLIAVSETLQGKLAGMGREARLLTHGVDLDFWLPANQGSSNAHLQDFQPPLIVCWGVIDQRMDVEFVKRLAGDLTEGTIVLVGPVLNPDPQLFAVNRVIHLPPLPYEQLPHVAHEADVLIMPYADLPVTRAIQPLKLKEYLATLKPTVVRDLPATRGWADCLDVADSPQSFSDLVRSRLVSGLPGSQRRARVRLSQESWVEKTRLFERWAFA